MSRRAISGQRRVRRFTASLLHRKGVTEDLISVLEDVGVGQLESDHHQLPVVALLVCGGVGGQ